MEGKVANLHRFHCVLLAVPCVREQYERNALLLFHGNSDYATHHGVTLYAHCLAFYSIIWISMLLEQNPRLV